ncbi:MAG: hypothetical protein PWQ87_112 [Candidatus Woesearchaeota archaeon]|nr:hypothetical protein [Candidatus Woesearchaeota archaeon]
MEKLKQMLISFLLLASLLISGCQQQTSQATLGTKGIEITGKMLNQNPYTTSSNINFELILDIINYGSSDVSAEDLYITYSGYDPSLFNLNEQNSLYSRDDVLYGRESSDQLPDSYSIAVDGSINLPFLSRDQDFEYSMNLFVKYCYKYTTELSTIVCIDPSQGESNGCKMQRLSFSGGQGAPVEFREVLPVVTPNELGFQVFVRNAGKGIPFPEKFFGFSHLQQCSFLNSENKDAYRLTVRATFEGKTIECSPRNAKVDSQGTYVFCSFGEPVQNDGPYSGLLTLTVDYIYVDSTSIPIKATFLKES